MTVIFGFLFFISFIFLVVGLINPKGIKFLIRKELKRAQIAWIGIGLTIFFLFGGAIVTPSKEIENRKQEVVKKEEKDSVRASSQIQKSSVFSLPVPESESKEEEREENNFGSNQNSNQPESDQEIFKVSYVIDGDTIKLENGEKVRLIGINAPESGQPYFNKAREKLTKLVLGKRVRLEKDVEDRDRYGRLLRYVFVDNLFINLEMVRSGFANSWTCSPNVKYQNEISAAEREAREKQIGLWQPSEEENSSSIILLNFHPNAEGDDNYNLNDEYFVLKNNSSNSIDMTGWIVLDSANHEFIFPNFVLESGKTVTIYSGSGINSSDQLFWNSEGAIWNNDGDTLYLKDKNGNLVLEYSY